MIYLRDNCQALLLLKIDQTSALDIQNAVEFGMCLEVNFQSHYHQPRESAREIQGCSANSIPDVIAQDLVETQTRCILRLGKCNSTIRSPRSLFPVFSGRYRGT